jgi:hypothetical protein
MSDTTSARSSPIGELEAAILEPLEPYFVQTYLQEVQESKGRVGAGFVKYQEAHEEARQQLAKAETELEQIRQRTEEIRAQAPNSVLESDEASDPEKEVFVSCSQRSESWPRRQRRLCSERGERKEDGEELLLGPSQSLNSRGISGEAADTGSPVSHPRRSRRSTLSRPVWSSVSWR